MFNFFKKAKKDIVIDTETDEFSILDSDDSDSTSSMLDSLDYQEVSDMYKLVPELDVSMIDWSKKIVLIMDDNETVLYFIENDFVIFETLANKLSKGKELTKVESKLHERVSKSGLESFLKSFKKSDYELIIVTTAYAAFSLRKALKDIKRIDFAILDILLGGVMQEDGTKKRLNLTGIDSAKDMLEIWDLKFCFYTGCDLGKYSPESMLFHKLLPDLTDLRDYVIPKDMDLTERRMEILRLLSNTELIGVAPHEK